MRKPLIEAVDINIRRLESSDEESKREWEREKERKETYRGKCLDRLLLQVIAVQVELGIVDGKPALCPVRTSQQRLDGGGHHPLVRAILGVLEVHVGDPVVGEVLGHLAGGTGGALADISFPVKPGKRQGRLVSGSPLYARFSLAAHGRK